MCSSAALDFKLFGLIILTSCYPLGIELQTMFLEPHSFGAEPYQVVHFQQHKNLQIKNFYGGDKLSRTIKSLKSQLIIQFHST